MYKNSNLLNKSHLDTLRGKYLLDQLMTYGMNPSVINTIRILYRPETWNSLFSETKEKCTLTLLILPTYGFFKELDIDIKINTHNPESLSTAVIGNHSKAWSFRTLHSYLSFSLAEGLEYVPLVFDKESNSVWFSFSHRGQNYLVMGTDLIEDLILFRQGDPNQVHEKADRSLWGFKFERPVYLYDTLIDKSNLLARPVDSWMLLLIEILSTRYGLKKRPLLPNNAKGVILLTGDDDQAYLESYVKQLQFIGTTPITYFMHPLTRVTRSFLKKLSLKHNIELGLHPDALDFPEKYSDLCRRQTFWFMRKYFKRPFSVRNHGYLNDGYWGHLPTWQKLGLNFSSNIPGYDGAILTGSLIPSKIGYNNNITNHWSVLTAFGDGMLFTSQYTSQTAVKKIYDFANEILYSAMPGVIVFNLHPQNIEQTVCLHEAVLDLIKDGFYPMTMSQCRKWFNDRRSL